MTDEEYQDTLAELKDGLEKVVKTAIKALEDDKYSGLEIIRTTQVAGELGMTVYYMLSEMDTKEERQGLVDYVHRADFKV